MSKTRFLLICAAIAAVYGCSSNCKDRGECECATRFDCNEDQVCTDGVCVDMSKEIWIVPEREFGESCISHRECIDGVCLPLGPDNGGVCSTKCETGNDCEEGWSCRAWTGSEYFSSDTHVCVKETPSRLCLSCAVDGHCNAVGDLCVELEEGRVCAQDCSLEPCPTGYTCQMYERDGASYAQCLPLDNTCECGAGKEGMGRACTNNNEFGVCAGWSYCSQVNGEYVWSDCDAQTPAAEICNGKDDDCDGLIDSFDPGLDYSELGEEGELYPICYLGGCVGRWQCSANETETLYSWHCDAGDPEREICNGVDDNCNGIIDEAFVNADGLYIDVDNCGSCGSSCKTLLSDLRTDENGEVLSNAATCEVHDGVAVCVPKLCNPGYYPYPHENPVSCIKLESPACQACGTDSDCHVYTDRCRELSGDFGTHCLQSCSENSPYSGCTGMVGVQSCCPNGYICQVSEGEKLCIPKGESCSCDESKLDMVRNCTASSGTDMCQGRQTCEKLEEDVYAWSTCSAQDLTVEVCDGQDNNCDGQIDEDFVDELGRYNAEEHCGKCNEDCPSRWKAKELHAEGACLLQNNNYACQFTGCKLEKEIFGKRCTDDQSCGSGMKCDRQVFYCVAETGEMPSTSCTQDSDCSRISSGHTCVNGVCKLEVQYHDVNGITADGCECGEAIYGGMDEPDMFGLWPTETSSYIDRDCDGIDGQISSSLFVSAQSDVSLGTMEHPYRTISEAINAFNSQKHTAILVAAGTYLEQVKMKSGVRMYGGYSADFKSRNIILNPTLISAPPPKDDSQPGTIYIPSLSRKTIVSGFTINGYDVSESMASVGGSGRNTYAIFLASASSNIYIVNNTIIAGRAGDGGRGKEGDSGQTGNDGSNGTDSRECSNKTCEGQTTQGGSGGKNSYCQSANGRPGATAQGGSVTQDYIDTSRDGAGGSNNSYTHAHEEHYAYCKYDCTSGGYANGSDGKNGDNGSIGGGGQGCSSSQGTVTNGVWAGTSGRAGSNGGAALGGGGGGAGGCGGQAGAGGGAGGGAFGIWIASVNTEANIYANQITLGVGGTGGTGG
ncbi:MAG: hypothetical protein J6A01_03645, partial [Proteobacteria bacterium]|nr:hypothetical protein [Pseudomonadota bacterium]